MLMRPLGWMAVAMLGAFCRVLGHEWVVDEQGMRCLLCTSQARA